jgi:hypothetical protein
MPPKSKAKAKQWGKADTKYLLHLIRTGDVDITNTSNKNVKVVQKAYFDHCNIKIFCCNFRDFAASLNLETEYSSELCLSEWLIDAVRS